MHNASMARLFHDASDTNADLYYLSGFLAGDPFLFVEHDGKTEIFLSDLEVDRANKDNGVDAVHRLAEIGDAIKEATGKRPGRDAAGVAACVDVIARERGIDAFEVADRFPLALADALRGLGYGVRALASPYVPQRAIKRPDEVAAIRAAVRHTEVAMQAAIDRIAAAEIRDGMLFDGDAPLTSESVKQTINHTLMDRGCDPLTPIVAGGEQGCDPHDRGSGPLAANVPIILDIFPQDLSTRYHGDMTRTVVRGKATDVAKKQFEAVKAAKAAGDAAIRAGVSGRDVHKAVKQVFKDRGYETCKKDGRMVGFFHGTGHGLGLDVHEYPGVGAADHMLKAGHVVTVEPGLYYPGVGGIRIEDDVLVTEDGHENLCELEVVFEV